MESKFTQTIAECFEDESKRWMLKTIPLQLIASKEIRSAGDELDEAAFKEGNLQN